MSSRIRALPFNKEILQPSDIEPEAPPIHLEDIAPVIPHQRERAELYRRYANKLLVNEELSRSLVSNQANKKSPFYRWYKYKEAFSSELIQYFLRRFRPETSTPTVLDPFAGAGTTLTVATREGWHAVGIELLPVGTSVIKARLVADRVNVELYKKYLGKLVSFLAEEHIQKGSYRFPHITITRGAFPQETEEAISDYISFLDQVVDDDVKYLFWFACFSVLEDVSYTRKDGQYLRWDNRSERTLKGKFDKGLIHEFNTIIVDKLYLMLDDLGRRNGGTFLRNAEIIPGSCLEKLIGLEESSFDLVITSPPYCNRYDYTRTYALELAFLNHSDDDIKRLRQTLLSATVENKSKKQWLAERYAEMGQTSRYEATLNAFREQWALREVLALLYEAREMDKLNRRSKVKSNFVEGSEKARLNNPNIPNMIEHYFFEMNFVIRELARVLTPGGRVVMVNDNVQYIGEEVPVDLILSDFAASAGLEVEHIWVLPKGKGNSSQQMGAHGRNELRKCIYVWSKPTRQ